MTERNRARILTEVEGCVTLLELRASVLTKRADALERQADEREELADIMESHSFEDTGQLWEAVESGEVTLPESAFGALVRIGFH